jgi:hypothetical protein
VLEDEIFMKVVMSQLLACQAGATKRERERERESEKERAREGCVDTMYCVVAK